MEDDIIDWDDENPPSLGEERIQRTLVILCHNLRMQRERLILSEC